MRAPAKYLSWLLLLVAAGTCGKSLAQDAGYVYQYHYGIINEATFMPAMDSDAIGKKYLENNVANTTISGTVFTNGTLLLLSLNPDKVREPEAFATAEVDLSLTAGTDPQHDHYILYTHDVMVQAGKGDTFCRGIDNTVKFARTGNTRKIAQWDCYEYKSQMDDYRNISVWASDAIPSAVNIGALNGVTGGVAEIENTGKDIKISLAAYKKLPGVGPSAIACTDKDGDSFRFADMFK